MKKTNKKPYNSKKIIIMTTIIILLVILTLGITYAYYETNIKGNNENTSANLTSDNLLLTYEKEDTNEPVTSDNTEENKSYIKKFTVKNYSKKQDQTFNIILEDIINTYEGNNWTYILKTGETVLSEGIITSKLQKQLLIQTTIEANAEKEYSLEVKYEKQNITLVDETGTEIEQNETFTGELKFKINITSVNINMFETVEKDTLLYAIGKDNYVVNPITIPGFEPSKEDEAELSYTTDDYGTSYYFRGNVQNNYVTYNNMCWRIVRVQGDGDIKLVLASEKGPCESQYLTETSAFINDAMPHSFSGGVTYFNMNKFAKVYDDDRDLKPYISNWYNEKKINSKESTWCSDRSLFNSIEEGQVQFGSARRYTSTGPQLRCNFIGDINTELTNTNGGPLKPPYVSESIYMKFALLTVDEVLFAGVPLNELAKSTYLAQNAKGFSWTLTPLEGEKNGWIYSDLGCTDGLQIKRVVVESTYYVRPSIVLDKNTKINTNSNGTLENPYVILNSA